ncbi:hypothetical protein AKJ61_01700 [candidate division MSBL1 archaeon SCGC-AAA259B11]|uniref:Tyr recombinase domain-containing protein n=1 Tax=candidate division MSBL1 archaeon SCGC-AAA259B11 TaxID=1698260 RepID=A0A133U708_9EURY|nr:hypothetical protein AKJ61_01700 [candidate division MSBL1 archaeon SCGC-AAA259B11]
MDRERPVTQDRAGKKEEWREIITNMDPLGRALYLALLSTGCRIGAMLSVRVEDLDLEADPARIHLRPSYTKAGLGDRTVFLTGEAEEHIRSYLDWRKGKKKSDGTDLDTDRLFPIARSTAERKLHNAIERSSLDIRKDKETGIREIHTHSTRKFFRSNCGLGEALTKASVTSGPTSRSWRHGRRPRRVPKPWRQRCACCRLPPVSIARRKTRRTCANC